LKEFILSSEAEAALQMLSSKAGGGEHQARTGAFSEFFAVFREEAPNILKAFFGRIIPFSC
jgi:hypothetical protein